MADNFKNIFDQLEAEHNKVKKLLKQAESCPPREREDMLEKIEEELVPHARGEEKTLYAVLRNRVSGDDESEDLLEQTEEAYQEHKVVDDMMADLKEMDPYDMEWKGQFEVIKENLEHHISEEEEEIFEMARKQLNEEDLNEIHQSYQRSKEKFSERLPTQSQISERTPVERLKKVTNL